MEYIKLLIPFIAGAFTTPIIEGIKNFLLFQKKEKLVMTEIADILEDISDSINGAISFLREEVGESKSVKNVYAVSLYSPIDIDVVFLRDNMEEFYIRSHRNSRISIKKILKGSDDLVNHQQYIIDVKKQASKDISGVSAEDVWVLYYIYLRYACALKKYIEGFMSNEEVKTTDYNGFVEKECAERGYDYNYLYENFCLSERIQMSLRGLPQ